MLLTYREAAARVHRSIHAIKRWRRGGMEMGWERREGQWMRVVDEEVLLVEYRTRLLGWPIHQQRMRKMIAEQEDRNMYVTEQVAATLDVAAERLAASAYASEWAMENVIRAVIHEGDRRAWKVRPESVHVSRIDREHESTFAGLWSPLAARFVGGEYDGDTGSVARQNDGWPLDVLTLPYRSEVHRGHTDTVVTRPLRNPTYQRVGIDPIDDIWVYRLLP